MDSADEQWRAKLTVLTELVSPHVQEEEKTLFEGARGNGLRFADELAEHFEEDKENLRVCG
jgi:hypothetical protein